MSQEQPAAVMLRMAAAEWVDGLRAPVTDAHDSASACRDRKLQRAAVSFANTLTRMAKKRGYSREFPTTRETRVYFMLDKIPPAFWIQVKAKARRDGVSLRALILRLLRDWLQS